MTLWQRFKAACRDQRGQFDFGGFGGFGDFGTGDFGTGLGNIDFTPGDVGANYFPGYTGTTPGPFTSIGPTGDSGGFNLGNILSGFGDFARQLSPLLGLGTTGLGAAQGVLGALQSGRQAHLASNAAQMQKQLAQQAQTTAAPLAGFSQNQLQLAQQGQIPPAIQAQIDQWKQQAKAQAADMAARSGQGDSTTLQAWYNWIDQQAQAMQASALQNMEQLGIQAGGTAGGVLGQAMQGTASTANIANANATGIESLIAAANQVLARLNAVGQ